MIVGGQANYPQTSVAPLWGRLATVVRHERFANLRRSIWILIKEGGNNGAAGAEARAEPA